jgi:hypothetical protein
VAQDNQVVIDFIGNTTQLQQSLQDIDKQVLKTGKDYETAFAEVNKANQQAEQGTKQLVTNLQDVNKAVANGAIKEYSKDIFEATSKISDQSKAINELIEKNGGAKKSLKELTADLEAMSRAGLKNTAEFKALVKVAAELEDSIGDTRNEIKKLASDTRVFDTLVQGARGMAAGFSLVTGTMAAFGSENENVQKTLLKVQGAMAALQGVQELANIATEKGGIATQIATASQAAYAFVVGTSTGAMKLFRLALAGTGIGLAVIAITELVLHWDELNEKVRDFLGLAAKEKVVNDEVAKSRIENFKQIKGIYEEEINLKKSKGEDTRKLELQRIKNQLDILESERKIYGASNEYYKFYASEKVALIMQQNKIEKQLYDERRKALGDLMKQQIADMREIDKMVEDSLFATADHLAEFRKTLSDSGADDPIITEETVAENKTNAEQMAKDLNASVDKAKKYNENSANKELEDQKSISQSAISIAQSTANAIFQIEADARNQKYESDLKKIQDARDKELSNKNLTETQKAAIDKKYAQEEAKLKLKQWQADKEAKLEQAVINGALAITNILATMNWATFGVAQALAIAGAVASTAAQVAVIASSKPPAYAKGTEYVEQGNSPSGVDTVHARLNIGERVVPTEINKQLAGIKNEDLPKLLQAAYYPPMPHAPEMSGLNAVVVKQDIDYKKLGKVIAEELRANPQTHINIDKGGFSLHVIEKGKKVKSLNNRYES